MSTPQIQLPRLLSRAPQSEPPSWALTWCTPNVHPSVLSPELTERVGPHPEKIAPLACDHVAPECSTSACRCAPAWQQAHEASGAPVECHRRAPRRTRRGVRARSWWARPLGRRALSAGVRPWSSLAPAVAHSASSTSLMAAKEKGVDPNIIGDAEALGQTVEAEANLYEVMAACEQ